MPIACRTCGGNAQVKRPKTGDPLCKECFYYAFEEEIHHTVVAGKLFIPGETVAIGASGGKDSTVLAHVMKVLNERHNYGLNLVLLSIDEGITGYRDDSLETVKINQKEYDLPLKIVSYQDLYGWTMDAIVKQIGMKNNCTYCGVFRRQALDRGAMLLKVDKIVTGHNADDIAETVIMNVLRGDIARLRRCTAITTGTDGSLPRCKPFKYTYEKDIVMYAFHKHLTYFSTECIYSPNAYRGFARAYIKDLERIQPSTIIDIIHSGESLSVKKDVRMPVQTTCTRCGYISSNELCKACVMLEGLNRGRPRLGIGKAHKERRLFEEELARQKTEGEGITAEATTSTPSPTPSRCCGRGACCDKRSRSSGIEGSAGIHSVIEDKIGNFSGDTRGSTGSNPESGLGSGDTDVLTACAYSPDALNNSLPLSDSRISSCLGGGCGRGDTDCTKGNLADCSAVDSVDIRVINGGDISAGGGGDAGSNPEKIGGDGDVEEVVNGVKKLRVFGQPAHSKPNVLDF